MLGNQYILYNHKLLSYCSTKSLKTRHPGYVVVAIFPL